MAMTWAELHRRIGNMGATAMNQHVAIFAKGMGEVFSGEAFGTVEIIDQNGDISGVLDDGHFVLQINA